MSNDLIQIFIYVIVFISAILIFDGIIRYTIGSRSYKKSKNTRLKFIKNTTNHEEALHQILKKRGLSEEGRYTLPFTSFNNLVLQSGTHIGSKNIFYIMLIIMLFWFVLSYYVTNGIFISIASGVIFGVAFPILWLLVLRRRRRKKIEEQLAETLDTLRRSLQAGHPISVAISMVAREMADPIGSEFGITSDEMTYGLDLETALSNLGARVGQADMSLLVISVSVQAKSGGNLSELLKNLAEVVRERQTLRRKVRALSAEGRFSAIALSLLPLILFCILLVIAPSFYGQVWGHPVVLPVLGATVIFTLIGDWVMYKMVNFKY